MKICYFTGDISVQDGHGGATHVLEVSRHLSHLGNEITVVSTKKQPNFPEIGKSIHVVAIRPPRFLKGPAASFGLALRLCRQTSGADILYVRSSSKDYVATFVGLLRNRPIVLEVNDPGWSFPSLKWADRIVTTSEMILTMNLSGERARKSMWENKVRVVTWAGNTHLFNPDIDGTYVRARCKIPADAPVVLYSGGFYPWHGLDNLVEASVKVLRSHPETCFLCVGHGEHFEKIVNLTIQHNVYNKFIFTGKVPYEEIPLFVASADITVAPYDPRKHHVTRRLGFFYTPIKLFEYMAAGKPIVTTDTGNIRNIVRNGVNGIIIKPGDPRTLAEAITFLIENKDKAKDMGRAARIISLSSYSWEKHADILDETFQAARKYFTKKTSSRLLGVLELSTYFVTQFIRRKIRNILQSRFE